MTDARNTKSFWDEKDYQFWEKTVAVAHSDRVEWAKRRFLRRLLPAIRGKVVLDLGCGPGVITPYLAAASDRVVGVDFSENAIAAARRRCAELNNTSFISGDVLDFACDQKFDVITGSMFLHEIMHEDTLELLNRLDSLLADGGFLCFHENSYFNFIGRFVRQHLVGKYGIPKHGSENELPFDEARFALYRDFFRHCERFVDGVELAQKVYEYLIPLKYSRISDVALVVDKMLTSIQVRTGVLNNWSYAQTIYASQTRPRSEVLGVASTGC